MKKNSNKNRSGFTLVEVVISILLLGISVAGLLQGYHIGYKTAINSTLEIEAETRILNHLETIKAMPYTSVIENNFPVINIATTQNIAGVDNIELVWTMTTSVVTVTSPDYKKIKLSANWNRFNRAHYKEFFTIKIR